MSKRYVVCFKCLKSFQPKNQQDENRAHPSTGHSSRSQSSERRKHVGQPNGFHANGKKQHPSKVQRVPTFDEFPTLNGTPTNTSTNTSPKASGPNGLTAAQVLQAPPPFRSKEGNRIPSPDQSVNGDASKAGKPIHYPPIPADLPFNRLSRLLLRSTKNLLTLVPPSRKFPFLSPRLQPVA